MELRQLEYFVAVAEERNFTRAAERLHVAQPAVSAQIQRLERELGQPLFDRTRRVVRLTAAGEAALPYARAALGAAADVADAVAEVTDLIRGSVRIGTVTSHNVDLPGLLADLHARHPGVEITLSADTTDHLIHDLRSGALDLAIVSIGSDERPAGLDFLVVTEEEIVAAVGRDDPWWGRRHVTAADFHGRTVIALPVGTGVRAQFDLACTTAGAAPRIGFEASTPQALADLAARGLGVAIVPRSVTASRADLQAVALVPELRGRLVLAWRTAGPMGPPTRVLLDMARRVLSVGADL
jgi:DNA-binding transcriptional LysR family regulator